MWVRRGPSDRPARIEEHARIARDLDPMDARPLALIGIAQLMSGDPVECRAALFESITLNPSFPITYVTLGSSFILSGEPEQAIEPLETAVRLSPHDHYLFHITGELAAACAMQEKWDEALSWAERSLRLRPGYWYPRVVRITAFTKLGDRVSAEREYASLMRKRPNFSTDYIDFVPFLDKRWNAFFKDSLGVLGQPTLQSG